MTELPRVSILYQNMLYLTESVWFSLIFKMDCRDCGIGSGGGGWGRGWGQGGGVRYSPWSNGWTFSSTATTLNSWSSLWPELNASVQASSVEVHLVWEEEDLNRKNKGKN